jgi:hypothetical protein
MQKEAQMQAEKRAYYQLLRRLLSDEVRREYRPEREPAPTRLSSLLNELKSREARSGKTA